jgi:hypothetical protein
VQQREYCFLASVGGDELGSAKWRCAGALQAARKCPDPIAGPLTSSRKRLGWGHVVPTRTCKLRMRARSDFRLAVQQNLNLA